MNKTLVNSSAIPFSLYNSEGELIKLTDILGRKNILLVFYPADMLPGCTIQLTKLRDYWPRIQSTKTEILAINHADQNSHTVFKTKYQFPFHLLVDADHRISKKYQAVHKLNSIPVIKRTVVIIDKNGKIVFHRYGMPKEQDIIKLLQKIK